MTGKNTSKKSVPVKINLGCGVHLIGGFINVDNFFSLKQLESKKGLYRNAVIEPGAEFVRADAAALPFADNSVDYIESIDMIEHIPHRRVVTVFSEIARVLKPGGKLAMMTNDFDDMAKLWTTFMTKEDFNPDHYTEISELVYGNQQGPGEFHTTPFNRWVLHAYIVGVGLTLDSMAIYPRGTTDSPNMQTQHWTGEGVVRSDMLWVEAHK